MLVEKAAEVGVAASAAVAGVGVLADLLDGPQTNGGDRLHDRRFLNTEATTENAGRAIATGTD